MTANEEFQLNPDLLSHHGLPDIAYLRWLQTQGKEPKPETAYGRHEPGWLFGQDELYSRRAPGNTCLSALREMSSLGSPACNDSKGCGGVMRVAPVGLFAWTQSQNGEPENTFQLGTELAALTHGHPTGSLTGGVLAVLVQALTDGASLQDALETAKHLLSTYQDHEETLDAIKMAEELALSDMEPEMAITKLGEGWVAEEALAISIYCALVARSFRQGVIMAVNHDGDSDSTGAITGNLLGAMYGMKAIPQDWLEPLELREVIEEMAQDLFKYREWEFNDGSVWKKYPGF